MVEGNHWDQWFSDGFGVRQPLVTMVFAGCAPLVRQWNGHVPSSKSSNIAQVKIQDPAKQREATTDHDDDRAEQTGAGHTDHGTNPTTIHALRPSSLSQKIRMVEKKRAIRDL